MRQHIIGKIGTKVFPQFRLRRGSPFFQDIIQRQSHIVVCSHDHGHALFDGRIFRGNGFDFAQLYAEAADLYLRVDAV